MKSFLSDGWDLTQPSLVGYRDEDGWQQLISGSHRRAAALLAGIRIPVRIFSHHEVRKAWGDLDKWQRLIEHGLVGQEMSEGSLTPERLSADIAEAKLKYDVVQSTDTTLLVDLDSFGAVQQFERVLPKVKELLGVVSVQRWKSRNDNEHALVTLSEPLPVAVRIALQAALGSDGTREVLAIKRVFNGCVEPSLLFRPRSSNAAD